ncbi:MAG: PIN domain-containing protein [Actinophytocola sp.]|nr:PIN domain-containing protein [Actinophytocola sp.]
MYLVDSDVLIAHLRGVEAAREWLREERRRSPLAISAVSVAEVTGGMRSAERRTVWQLLGSFRVEPVTGLAAGRAGEFMRKYRRSHSGIGTADYLIAGTAEVRGFQLATLNVRHFPMFAGLKMPFTV